MNVSDSVTSPFSSRTPLIMGVVNLTPDSFSDGGAYLDPDLAWEQARRLVVDGADIIDLGAESTRPGANPVAIEEEWNRLEPVLKRLALNPCGAAISIDTRHPDLMLRAATYGASWFNDVGGQASPAHLAALATRGEIKYIAMHMASTPNMMQREPLPPKAALAKVTAFFAERSAVASRAGFAAKRVWLDPGIGFGKTDAANVQLMQAVNEWAKTQQIAVGISRKSFIGRALGISEPRLRDQPSKMLELGLAMLGAKLIRTHEVKSLKPILAFLGEDQGG